MAKFKVGDTVTIKTDYWGKPNPPVGTVVNKYIFHSILHGDSPSTISQFETAVRDNGRCEVGYDVLWSHNECVNPWSEIELEEA